LVSNNANSSPPTASLLRHGTVTVTVATGCKNCPSACDFDFNINAGPTEKPTVGLIPEP
jgi:hypothetical protein